MRLVFDIETDGLFDDVSKVHCIVLKDLDTKEVITPKIKKAMQLLGQDRGVNPAPLSVQRGSASPG